MKKIYFRNSKKWNNPFAIVYNRSESDSDRIILSYRDDDGDFVLDFDDERYDHVAFSGDEGEKTGNVYPGKLSIGVEYKRNEGIDRDLTYLFSKACKATGRIDNYVLKDEKNLGHRDDKSKRISVFVPSEYTKNTPFDILYFFDAQNLFCEAGEYTQNGDPYGSWQLDVVLTELQRQYGKNIIVVGIDNADKYRDRELFMDPSDFGTLAPLATALPDEDYSSGQLDGLCDFIVETLHPFIKAKYCVNDNIGIGGSSMGGIAAFYCGLRELGFFNYVLSYSPAFGLYEMSAFEHYFSGKDFAGNASELPRIHVYCGGSDLLEQMLLPSSKAMREAMEAFGYDSERIFETYDGEKPHNEESWRLILPQSFTYLLK